MCGFPTSPTAFLDDLPFLAFPNSQSSSGGPPASISPFDSLSCSSQPPMLSALLSPEPGLNDIHAAQAEVTHHPGQHLTAEDLVPSDPYQNDYTGYLTPAPYSPWERRSSISTATTEAMPETPDASIFPLVQLLLSPGAQQSLHDVASTSNVEQFVMPPQDNSTQSSAPPPKKSKKQSHHSPDHSTLDPSNSPTQAGKKKRSPLYTREEVSHFSYPPRTP